MATVADLILRNKHFLDQFTNGINARLIAELQKAQKDILEKLIKGNLEKLTRAHYRSVLAEVQNILKNTYGGFEDTILSSISNAARQEYWSISNAIRSQAGLEKIAKDAPLQGIPTQALKEILTAPIGGHTLKKWIEKQNIDTIFRAESVITQGFIRGQGMSKIAYEMKKAINISENSAMMLSRTAIMNASNRALDYAYKKYDKYIEKYRYLGTLDHKTCLICASLDGEEHKSEDDFKEKPLIHPGCRCLISPITRFESDEAQRPARIPEKEDWNKRRPKYKVHEKVSAKTSYREWFQKQDEWFQKEWLGPARYELYKSGQLKFTKFADLRTNTILSLDELKKKYDIDLSNFKKGQG